MIFWDADLIPVWGESALQTDLIAVESTDYAIKREEVMAVEKLVERKRVYLVRVNYR
jgi:hypothetical protein